MTTGPYREGPPTRPMPVVPAGSVHSGPSYLPAVRRRSPVPWIVAGLVGLVVLCVGSFVGFNLAGGKPKQQAAAASSASPSSAPSSAAVTTEPAPPPPPAPTTSAPPSRVTGLMAKLGCKSAAIIATEMYATETGRCVLSGVDVTIAAFDSTGGRDDWVAEARQSGGGIATGADWAAHAGTTAVAQTIASKLGGTYVKPPAAPKTTAGNGGGGSVYYKNCDAVRAAGKAPLHRGEPGYRAGLDRDGDGVACEN